MSNKDLLEAKMILETLLLETDSTLAEVKKVKFWSWADFFGGDIFVSFIKRDKIKKINASVALLQRSIEIAQKELKDIQLSLTEIPDALSDNVWDVWIDNVFTDIRVKKEIDQLERELNQFKEEISMLINRVSALLNGCSLNSKEQRL